MDIGLKLGKGDLTAAVSGNNNFLMFTLTESSREGTAIQARDMGGHQIMEAA